VLWKMVSMAMLCCWSLPAWAADPWCSPGGASALRFEWLPKDTSNPSIGSVRIQDASGNIVQTLDDLESYYGDSESLGTGTDFNNDSCPDLLLVHSKAPIGNESVRVFLYNAEAKRFEINEAVSELAGPSIDPDDKNCLISSSKGGAEDVYSAKHCWNKGKLVLQSEYDISPLYKDGKFQCFQHTSTVYRGGKKRTRTNCTKKF